MMTVKELINLLTTMPQDALVVVGKNINVVDIFNSIAKSIFEKMKENQYQIRTPPNFATIYCRN